MYNEVLHISTTRRVKKRVEYKENKKKDWKVKINVGIYIMAMFILKYA